MPIDVSNLMCPVGEVGFPGAVSGGMTRGAAPAAADAERARRLDLALHVAADDDVAAEGTRALEPRALGDERGTGRFRHSLVATIPAHASSGGKGRARSENALNA